jgi:type IV pilus assembly protein PilM
MAINNQKRLITGYGSTDLDPAKLQESLNTGNDYFTKGLQELLSNRFRGHMPSNHVAVGVPTARTYNRIVEIPATSADKIDEAVRLEAEQYIPTPLAELSVDYEIIEQSKTKLTVLMSAVPKRLVESVTDSCKAAGLEVVLIEPGISAVARLITHSEHGQIPTIAVDMGAASTDIVVLDRMIRVTGVAQVGGNTITLAISEKMNVSLETAHQLKVLKGLNVSSDQKAISAAIEPHLSKIANEVRKMIRYYSERLEEGNRKIEQIVIVGAGSNIPGIGDYFTNAMLMPARLDSPWHMFSFGHLAQPSRQYKPRYITAAGLASVEPREIWR